MQISSIDNSKERLTWRTVLMMLWGVAIWLGWAIGPFCAAGTLRWPIGWAYLAFLGVTGVVHGRFVARKNPDLVLRRRRVGAGTPKWDVIWNLLYWPLMISIAIVAGLDVRMGRSAMSLWLWPIGAALVAGGLTVSALAMVYNRHFEGTVRIQKELEHRVVDTGPYRVIRHPGYLGLCLLAAGSAFLLLSLRALFAAALVIVWLILRTALEDRFLQRELEGYAAFTKATRFRLLPGVW